jgi:flavin-dependent dehydrogenase
LQRHGVPVVLRDAGRYPRHRVCGEFIAGLAPSTVSRLGLAPILADALQHREVAWFLPGEPVRLQRLPEPALGISRHVLDVRIADAFVAAGGTLETGVRVTDLAPRPGRVFATGRRRGPPAWIGLKVHVRSLELARELELHLGEQSSVGLAQIENGEVNVCGLFRRRPLASRGSSILISYLNAAGLEVVAQRIAGAEHAEESFCAVAGLDFDRRVEPADVIRLGDACAMIPPFTGNGMAMAFQSAEAALDPLLAYAGGQQTWKETCRDTHASLRRRFRLRLASAQLLHPFLLEPRRQRCLAALNRAQLIPLTPLYATLH